MIEKYFLISSVTNIFYRGHQKVEMSSQIILVFCILIFSQPIIGEDDHDHDDHGEEEEGALHHIFEHLNVTTKDHEGHLVAERHHLEKLFYDLNFKNCSQDLESTTCSLCMRAEEFLSWNGLGKKSNFSEEDFHEFIGGFVYLLSFPSNDNAVCKNVIKNITSTSPSFYNQILTKHGVGSLNETGIEKILEQINSTIGVKLSSKKCFSAHEVFKAVNKSHSASLNEEQFEQASAFIVSQLVEKHCIEEEHHDDDHDDHDHDHDHDHEEDLPKPEYFIEEIFEAYGEENKTGISPEKFKNFYKKVKLGNQTAEDDHDDHDDHDEHEGHDHKRRRRATDDEHAKYKKCYSAEQILEIYGLTKGSRINQTKFSEICPSLIQQLDSGVCASSEQTTKTPTTEHHDDEEPKWRPWIGMIVSITIISLASLAGACTTPVTHKRWFELLLVTMIALVVAVMIGDAVLHLFPHALNLHGHDDGHDHAHEDGNPLLKEDSYIWKSLLLLLGVYIFMQFELVMNALGAGHSHGQAADHVISNGNANGSIPMNDEKKPTTFEYADSTPKKGLRMKDFQTVVWMIIIGDALHNFLDGVAIGTAFTDTDKSYLGGISTSIAIFAHELPHELGDFAVLISSGLSIKQALMMNFLSSLTAFVGGFVGVAMGLEWKASPWIFAIVAGLFIYIALVNMLPEILHSNVLKTRKVLTIALVNVGLWIGFAIMFILGVYEDDIKSSL